ncbi:MAG: 50S ribosomal protein L11 methyltransferase [Thermoanaerobaculia bacterium]
MIRDRVRMDAFTAALKQRVTPGCTVVDLGAGSGILSLLACKFGAGKVYAIEPDDIIELARRNAAASGVSDRITFIQSTGQKAVLDDLADVVVSDLRGVLPWFDGHLDAILDARRRFLRPDGHLIGMRDELWAAVVSDAALHDRHMMLPSADDAVNLTPMRSILGNSWTKGRITPESIVSSRRRVAAIDYLTFEKRDLTATVLLPVDRDADAHGVAVWFDAELAPGVTLSNRPGAPELIYGCPFFPWPEAVELHEGDTVELRLSATPGAEDFTWRWQTRISGRDGTQRVELDQSTFHGMLIPERRLRTAKATFVPALSDEGERDRAILALMDGVRANEEIASALEARFGSFRAALDRIATLAEKYAR